MKVFLGLETVLRLNGWKTPRPTPARLGDIAKDNRALVSGTPGVLVMILLIKNEKLSQNHQKNIITNAKFYGLTLQGFWGGGGPVPPTSAEPLGPTVWQSTECRGKLQGCKFQACNGCKLQRYKAAVGMMHGPKLQGRRLSERGSRKSQRQESGAEIQRRSKRNTAYKRAPYRVLQKPSKVLEEGPCKDAVVITRDTNLWVPLYGPVGSPVRFIEPHKRSRVHSGMPKYSLWVPCKVLWVPL